MIYLCYHKQQKEKIMANTLSTQTKTQTAIQMVIMDAIEKGHTNANELIDYMKSEVFETAVKNYISLIDQF